ncbi:MAG: glycosyltransferase family 4 protein [Lentisphaeria bacterium]|nr:glycosyltransferase family 4 protein [Lentisphaeria bacterium]
MSQSHNRKIAYIVAEYPSLTETFVAREIQALRQAGLTVQVFALDRWRGNKHNRPAVPDADRIRYSSGFFTPASLRAHGRFLIRKFPAYCALFLRTLFGKGIRGRRGIPRRFRLFHRVVILRHYGEKEGVTRFHAQFAHVTAEIAREAARVLNIPFSVGTHAWDIFSQEAENTRAYLRGADVITCCTRKGIKRLQTLLPREHHANLLLVRHGLPADILKHCSKGKGHLILAVGRLVPKKGYCDLIDACDLLRSDGLDITCLIVGDGELRKPLTEMIKILKLDDCVRLTGEMRQAAVMALMETETAVFCHPSIIDEQGDHDGLPNVILEAMCCGLPVVSTTVSAADEIITNTVNGVLIPQKNPDALAHALGSLLTNPGLRAELGANARETILEHFAAADCVKPLADRFLAG